MGKKEKEHSSKKTTKLNNNNSNDDEKKKNLEKLMGDSTVKRSASGRQLNDEDSKLAEDIGPESFRIVELLGVGSQGRVYLVQLNGTENYYAMKVFKKEKIINNEKTTRSILTEHRFLATSQHPFVTKLFYSFQTPERLFMVMEYCAGGELFTLIKRQPLGRLDEDQVRFYASEVLLVLEFVHSKGYIYRDLKPENILIHSDGHIRMADFGLSKQSDLPPQIQLYEKKEKKLFGKSKTTIDVSVGEVLRTNSLVGSVHYLAPEVLISSSNEGYNVMADWWAFGVLLYDMLFGFPPFQGRTNEEIIMKIVHGEYYFPDDIPASPQIKSLIKALLKVDPKKRFCCKHGASDIKTHAFFEGTNWGLLRHRTPPVIPELSGPCDTSNFMIYDEDLDSVEFQYFSEITENNGTIAPEFQEKFESFKYKSNIFDQIIHDIKGSDDKEKSPKEEKEKKRKKKDRKSLKKQNSKTLVEPEVKKEPENEQKEKSENLQKNGSSEDLQPNNNNNNNNNNEPDKEPPKDEKPIVEEKVENDKSNQDNKNEKDEKDSQIDEIDSKPPLTEEESKRATFTNSNFKKSKTNLRNLKKD